MIDAEAVILEELDRVAPFEYIEPALSLTRRRARPGRRVVILVPLIAVVLAVSLKAIDDLDAFFSGYGLIVIDECHHLPAFSFEAAVRHASARHFLGLTATPYRRDGLQEIVTMQCGPIRHRIASSESPVDEISLELIVRKTELAFADAAEQPIHEVFRLLAEDEQRAALVCDDVLAAVAASSSTPAASCEPTREKRVSASTTTPTSECQYCGPCTRDA